MSATESSITASASDVQKNFGAYHDRAMNTPVRVTKYGRETVFIISAEMFHKLLELQNGEAMTETAPGALPETRIADAM